MQESVTRTEVDNEGRVTYPRRRNGIMNLLLNHDMNFESSIFEEIKTHARYITRINNHNDTGGRGISHICASETMK